METSTGGPAQVETSTGGPPCQSERPWQPMVVSLLPNYVEVFWGGGKSGEWCNGAYGEGGMKAWLADWTQEGGGELWQRLLLDPIPPPESPS